ncbi:hypothetical protein GWK47_017245 [Chionoecetes opilio]|uniref:Uncharacterized protein n=1 Tax=Chionoecetes opilio TaxID=41210 RepID=A0A8J5BYM8_CHIOP|nr:hypothetical protein GWK47_017245 [Chionoecetes opilio]
MAYHPHAIRDRRKHMASQSRGDTSRHRKFEDRVGGSLLRHHARLQTRARGWLLHTLEQEVEVVRVELVACRHNVMEIYVLAPAFKAPRRRSLPRLGRNDKRRYKELAELPDQGHKGKVPTTFRKPGSYHYAEMMAKVIYTLHR